MEATTGIEPVIRVLQTLALPLGYVANFQNGTGGRNRTDTASRPQDFKSCVSTNFTTPAQG